MSSAVADDSLDLGLARYLSRLWGADVRIKNTKGETALSYAKRGPAEASLGQRAPQGLGERKKRNQLDGIIDLLQNEEAKKSGGIH